MCGGGDWKMFPFLVFFSLVARSCILICILYNTYNIIYHILDIFSDNREFVGIHFKHKTNQGVLLRFVLCLQHSV